MIHQIFIVLCLGILLVSCRKDIDFTEEELTTTFGPNNPNLEILKPWEQVVSMNGYATMKFIESNGEDMFFVARTFSSGWQISKLDSSGVVTPLLTNLFEPTVLTYQAPLFYSALMGTSSNNVAGFNTSGVQYTLGVALTANKYINKIIKDADTLHLLGNFNSAGSNLIPNGSNACSVNTNTGLPLPDKGMNNIVIFDAHMINGQLIISGAYISGFSSRCMARWNGSSWQYFNYALVENNTGNINEDRAIVHTFAPLGNGDIIVSGKLKKYSSSIAYSQVGSMTNAIFPEFVGSDNWIINRALVKKTNGYILAHNQVKFYNSSFTSVYVYNGSWKSIGALGEEAKDVTVHQGYVYAVTATGIKRHRIE